MNFNAIDWFKPVVCGLFATTAGVVYFAVPTAGGKKLGLVLNIGNDTDKLIKSLSIGATINYTFFTYNLLNQFKFRFDSPLQVGFLVIAPLAAMANFNAGRQGSLILGFESRVALAIAFVNYTFRMINYIDSSVKIRGRMIEIIDTAKEACQTKAWAEFGRLLFAAIITLSYIVSATDAQYSALSFFSKACHMNHKYVNTFCMTFSIVAAFGMSPSIYYWTHRGISELTFGRQSPIPCDRYTIIGLLLSLPSMMGSFGNIATQSNLVFSKLGLPARIIAFLSSLFYATFAYMPGIAAFLRTLVIFIKDSCNPRLENVTNESHRVVPIPTNSVNEVIVSPRSFSMFHNSHELVSIPSSAVEDENLPETSGSNLHSPRMF